MADALTSALMLDKLNKSSKAPRRRRRTGKGKGRGKGKRKSTVHRKWKWMKTPETGILFKVAKEGYFKSPLNGRYVRKTIENIAKHYQTGRDQGELDVNMQVPPGFVHDPRVPVTY